MDKRKILIISYLFPPMGGIGVQRALSLAKYLPQCGYEVHVLTAHNAAGPVYDPGLLSQVPAHVVVHKTFTPEIPFAIRHRLWHGRKTRPALSQASPGKRVPLTKRIAQRIFCPEPEILWTPFATRAATNIVRKCGIDTVLVTAPPFSSFVVGNELKKRFPAITLVSDFRDEWLTFYINNNEFQNNEHARRRAAQIERQTIERSDLVVAVTESSLCEIRQRYPDQPEAKFHCVPNGYDPELFRDFQPRRHGGSKVVVTHVGTVYPNSSPRYYLDALDQMPDDIRGAFETRFVGRIAAEEQGTLANRQSDVRLLGVMPQAEALKAMEDADYLLITMTDRISMPGKMYEYLATRKPLLAITPVGSEVERIVADTCAGITAAPEDDAGIRKMLACAKTSVHMDQLSHVASASKYERPSVVATYARLMLEIATVKPTP